MKNRERKVLGKKINVVVDSWKVPQDGRNAVFFSLIVGMVLLWSGKMIVDPPEKKVSQWRTSNSISHAVCLNWHSWLCSNLCPNTDSNTTFLAFSQSIRFVLLLSGFGSISGPDMVLALGKYASESIRRTSLGVLVSPRWKLQWFLRGYSFFY